MAKSEQQAEYLEISHLAGVNFSLLRNIFVWRTFRELMCSQMRVDVSLDWKAQGLLAGILTL